MSKVKKLIVLALMFIFFCTFAGLGLSAVLRHSDENPLIYISEEIRIQTTSYESSTHRYIITFSGKLINNSKENLEDVTIKIYLENNETLQTLPVTLELDKFLAGQTYELSANTYKTINDPKSVYKVSFSVENSEEVYIKNPQNIANFFVDVMIYFIIAFMSLITFVSVLVRKAKNLVYTDNDGVDYVEDIDCNDDDFDNDKHENNENNAELAEKELEVEKLKLEVEKQKLENSKLQQAQALKTCPYCGTVSKAKTLKCPNCGANLKH